MKNRLFMKLLLAFAIVIVVGCKKENNRSEASADSHEYVDLGLPSGNLWATCNVGAGSQEEIGYYFAWGETVPKDTYSWDNYRYGDYVVDELFELTKYCTEPNWGLNGFVDNMLVLESVDDAALANWGAGWRMPSKEDFEELVRCTKCEWTTSNGVEGILFTAKNGNTMFMPATGYRCDGELYCTYVGMYWSTTLFQWSPERSWSLHFDDEDCHVCGTYERNRGQVVRALKVGAR